MHLGGVGGTDGPTVGRESELLDLGSFLESVRGGMVGSLVLRGAAGVGKSHLLDRVARLADQQGMLVLRCNCHPGEGAFAYSGLMDLMAMVTVENWDCLPLSSQHSMWSCTNDRPWGPSIHSPCWWL